MYRVANSHEHTLYHQHLALETTLALFTVLEFLRHLGRVGVCRHVAICAGLGPGGF